MRGGEEEDEEEDEENQPPSNMIQMYEALKMLRRMRSRPNNYDQQLPVTAFLLNPTNKNQVYLLLHQEHFYAILDIVDTNTIIIADGANQTIDNLEEIKKTIKRTSSKTITIQYTGQIGLDHCGSSAIIIALEYLRLWNLHKTEIVNNLPQVLSGSKSMRNDLIKRLHKNKTGKLNTGRKTFVENTLDTRCKNCSKYFKKRTGLANHMRSCK